MPTKKLGRMFAYRRDSPFYNRDLEAQLAAFQATASWFGREFVQCFHDDDASVKAAPCHERPGFTKLLEGLQPGDDVMVWRATAVGGDLETVIDAMQTLAQRDVNLRVLDTKIGECCIPPSLVPVGVIMLRAFTRWFKESHREATRDSLAWRRKLGFVTKPVPGYGKQFRAIGGGLKTCRGTSIRREDWDHRECAQIRQIRSRRLAGESYASIARDFFKRGERRSNGDLWAEYRGRGKNRRISIHRIRNADRFYLALRAKGQDLEGLPVMPIGPWTASAE